MDPGFKSISAFLSAGIVFVTLWEGEDLVSVTENTRPPLWDHSPQIFNRNSSLRLSASLLSWA